MDGSEDYKLPEWFRDRKLHQCSIEAPSRRRVKEVLIPSSQAPSTVEEADHRTCYSCFVLGYCIAGAAWATLASRVVAAYMRTQTLNKEGYNAFASSCPLGGFLFSPYILCYINGYTYSGCSSSHGSDLMHVDGMG